MKYGLFVLALVTTLNTAVLAQFDNGQLDKGYGALAIDKPLRDIQSFLVKANPANLWNRNTEGMEGYLSSYWTVNLSKAGLTTYFGLPVERCEVLCDLGYNEETGEELENIFSFTFYLKKPQNEKQDADFIGKIFDQYGEANLYPHPETGEILRFDWFSEITLLVVSRGVDSETGEALDYYVADYAQAYGG